MHASIGVVLISDTAALLLLLMRNFMTTCDENVELPSGNGRQLAIRMPNEEKKLRTRQQ